MVLFFNALSLKKISKLGVDMLYNLKETCKPRKTVFEKKRTDIVLELSDLIKDKISPEQFFSENYVTSGMNLPMGAKSR